MKKASESRLNYHRPCMRETGVSLESSLLVESTRLQVQLDELENVNAGTDASATDFYFEF